MAKKTKKIIAKEVKEKMHHCHHCHGSNAVYGLGFIGAAIYYLSHATGFWNGVLGFLKAIVWPVFVTYGLLKFLGM
jgi:hypothetical protein